MIQYGLADGSGKQDMGSETARDLFKCCIFSDQPASSLHILVEPFLEKIDLIRKMCRARSESRRIESGFFQAHGSVHKSALTRLTEEIENPYIRFMSFSGWP